MMIGNGNKQNNYERPSVNTNSKQFSNKDGFCPSALKVGFWNELISFKMHPALPMDKQTATSVFDYNQTIMTSLTIEKAIILHEKIVNIIEPAIKDGIVTSSAVLIGMSNLVHIGSGIKGEIKPFIAIHKDLNPDSKIPNESLYYEFNTTDSQTLATIDDYDAETGSYKNSEKIHAEFILFKELLMECIKGLSLVSAHADRYVNRYYKEKVSEDLAQIGGKLGLQLKKENNGGFGGYSNNRNAGVSFSNNSNSNNYNGGTQAPVNNLSNLSEIDSFLD